MGSLWRKLLQSGMSLLGKHARLRVLLAFIAVVSLVALVAAVSASVGAPSEERAILGPARRGYDEELLAFVESEADAERETSLIQEVLQGGQLDPRGGGQRGRKRPAARYAPFWPQFRALLRARFAMPRYSAKVMQRLVATIKAPIDGLASKRRYASCAVVGNSGILLNSTHGEAIDAHEAVVRLNNARAAGFEAHVGRKTSIAFMNSNVLHRCARRVRCYCGEAAVVVYVSQVQHLMDVAMCRPAHAAPLLVTDPRFDALTARIAKWYSVREFVERSERGVREWPWQQGFHYSSGLQAVILALAICEEVDLYGFGKVNGTRHHYHTAQAKELDIHDYAAEYAFYDELAVPSSREAIPFLRDAGIRLPRVRVFGHDRRVGVAK